MGRLLVMPEKHLITVPSPAGLFLVVYTCSQYLQMRKQKKPQRTHTGPCLPPPAIGRAPKDVSVLHHRAFVHPTAADASKPTANEPMSQVQEQSVTSSAKWEATPGVDLITHLNTLPTWTHQIMGAGGEPMAKYSRLPFTSSQHQEALQYFNDNSPLGGGTQPMWKATMTYHDPGRAFCKTMYICCACVGTPRSAIKPPKTPNKRSGRSKRCNCGAHINLSWPAVSSQADITKMGTEHTGHPADSQSQ